MNNTYFSQNFPFNNAYVHNVYFSQSFPFNSTFHLINHNIADTTFISRQNPHTTILKIQKI